uniref:Uncharacterized protein n=1 Tax=Myotis myotis TaxID=51298 RepID=A0A7J7WW60_MYOMY|nr:hypothetical protein mMyoMyo1_011963 [Myotis myotis]
MWPGALRSRDVSDVHISVKPSSSPMRWPARMPTWPSHTLREPLKAAPSTKQFTGGSSADHLREPTQPCNLNHHHWLTQGRKKRQGARRWVSRRISPQEQQEAREPEGEIETEDHFKLKIEALELSRGLSPESPGGQDN